MAREPATETRKTGRPATSTDASLYRLLPLAWPLFTLLWLLFPAGSVIEMLRADLSPIRLLVFLVSMAAFVGVFLWIMLRHPFWTPGLVASERRSRTGLLAALAVLAAYLELAYGSGIPYHFMFVVIAAAVTLSTRYAALTVVTIALVASGIYALRSGWEAIAAAWESAVAPFLIVGFSMVIVSRLVVTVCELQAAREEISRLAVAEERLRFARDLHDLLGHSLSQITLKSELAGRLLTAAPEKAAMEVRDIENVARKALREVREAVAGYWQPTLDGELQGAREMLEAAGISSGIENRIGGLPKATEAVLAWTVREGVTNIIRHSRAGRCEIRLGQGNGEVHAEVRDDGSGPEHGGAPAGSGLSGLAERVARSGGNFDAGPLPGGGFRLAVSLPLHRTGFADAGMVSEADGRR